MDISILNWEDKIDAENLAVLIAQYGAESFLSAAEINALKNKLNLLIQNRVDKDAYDADLADLYFEINNKLVDNPFLGPLTPTDVPPTPSSTPPVPMKGYFETSIAGTYPNAGGVVVPVNSTARIYRSAAGGFSISYTALDMSNYVFKSDLIFSDLFDKDTIALNHYVNSGGGLSAHNDFWTSAVIEVVSLETYTFNQGVTFVLFIKDNLAHSYIAQAGTTHVTIPDGVFSMVLSASYLEADFNTFSISYTKKLGDNPYKFPYHGYDSDVIPTLKDINDLVVFEGSKVIGNFKTPNASFNTTDGICTYNESVLYNGFVKDITIQVSSIGDVEFFIGILDQYNKAIIRDSFSVYVPSISKEIIAVNVAIKRGEYLFLKKDGRVKYIGNTVDTTLGQFIYNNAIGEALLDFGVVGVNFGAIPFQYSVQYYDSQFAFKDELTALETNVTILKNRVESDVVKLKSPDGNKWLLKISNTGVISSVSLVINKWVALGNSITKHPIASYWWGVWGMAATVKEKDWVHVLKGKMTLDSGIEPVTVIENIAAWELAHNGFDLTSFDSFFEGDEDLIVLKIGENVSNFNNYEANYTLLVEYLISKAPSARVIICGSFWINETIDTAHKNVADLLGLPFVKLSQLDAPIYKSTVDTQVFGDDGNWHTISDGGAIAGGVANHPGDLGMQEIANAVFFVL